MEVVKGRASGCSQEVRQGATNCGALEPSSSVKAEVADVVIYQKEVAIENRE
jgi:hypothetical protein